MGANFLRPARDQEADVPEVAAATKHSRLVHFRILIIALLFGTVTCLQAAEESSLLTPWIVKSAVGTYRRPKEIIKEFDLAPSVSTEIPNSAAFQNVSVRLVAWTHERMIMCATPSALYGGRIMADYQFRAADLLPVAEMENIEFIKRIWDASQPLFESSYYRGRLVYFGGDAASEDWMTVFMSGDKKRIVVVRDDGPIQFSDSSGNTWTGISDPGDYVFTLTTTTKGSTLNAVVSLSNHVQTAVGKLRDPSTGREWYSVASTASGRKLVLAGGSSQNAPVLSISDSATNICVSWSAAVTGYTLQECGDLSAPQWVNITNKPVATETEYVVTLPVSARQNFFRLKATSPP